MGSPRGNGQDDLGTGAVVAPTSIRPPWASTIRLAMAMPRPVPLVLVVKNGSKIFSRCSGSRPGPLSGRDDSNRG